MTEIIRRTAISMDLCRAVERRGLTLSATYLSSSELMEIVQYALERGLIPWRHEAYFVWSLDGRKVYDRPREYVAMLAAQGVDVNDQEPHLDSSSALKRKSRLVELGCPEKCWRLTRCGSGSSARGP